MFCVLIFLLFVIFCKFLDNKLSSLRDRLVCYYHLSCMDVERAMNKAQITCIQSVAMRFLRTANSTNLMDGVNNRYVNILGWKIKQKV